jgi:hypothetical protein
MAETATALMGGVSSPLANRDWVDAFKAAHGHVPRVLHVGNIANNAYNIAKLLNDAGLDCDVICYDYYHVMGSPEWEDANITGSIADQFRPDWASLDLHGFRRPRWFAQGPLHQCIDYLVAKRSGDLATAEKCWTELGLWNRTVPGELGDTASAPQQTSTQQQKGYSRYLKALLVHHDIYNRARRRFSAWDNILFPVGKTLSIALATGAFLAATGLRPFTICFRERRAFARMANRFVRKFKQAFPSRADMLTRRDVQMYGHVLPEWRRLFECYDIVQAYATDPILPLLANTRPYVAFEHGTLRDFTLRADPICRLTSLAYREADHVFITNGDCLAYANAIGVGHYSPMLHPVNEGKIRAIAGDYENLHREIGAKYLFLCTLRHDWAIKGTDQYLRALPQLAAELGGSFRVLMTNWGAQLLDSRRLAQELGVSQYVVWLDPLPRHRLVGIQKSVDIVFDQIALPHFGATAPEAIAAEVPVIMSYDPASTKWLVEEPAPILSARCAQEIVAQVKTALDPVWLQQYKLAARRWIDKYHNSQIVVASHMSVYRELLSGRAVDASANL